MMARRMATSEQYGLRTGARAHLKGCIGVAALAAGSEYLSTGKVWNLNGHPRSDPADHRLDRQYRHPDHHRRDSVGGRVDPEPRADRWHAAQVLLATATHQSDFGLRARPGAEAFARRQVFSLIGRC